MLKVGLVGTSQLSFPGDKEEKFQSSKQGLMVLSKQLGFELFSVDQTIITGEQAEQALKQLKEEEIDFLIVQCTSFSAGILAPIFAKSNVHFGIWAIAEDANEGAVPFNSLCSVNMFASIISNYCKEYSIPYKWFYGNVDNELFKIRFEITIRALSALKKLKASKVALIGGIAPGFNDLYFDERIIEKTFSGIEINRLHEFSEIKDRALSYKYKDIDTIITEMAGEATAIHPSSRELLETSARFYKAYKEFVKEYGYNGLAISCWPKFQQDFRFSVCLVVAKLNDDGIVAACEGDLPSAVSMLMLQYLSNDSTMLMDLSDFDEKDETVLLWHCGPAAKRYSNNRGYSLGVNYHGLPHEKGKELNCCGVVRDMIFRPGHITIARIAGEGNKFFLAEGDFIDYDKGSFCGSRGWMGNIKFNRENISVRDFINTILVNGFQHHYPLVAGDFSQEVMEIAAWLRIDFINKIEYQNYLQNRRF